jgi:formate dehydrogenase beta subunit
MKTRALPKWNISWPAPIVGVAVMPAAEPQPSPWLKARPAQASVWSPMRGGHQYRQRHGRGSGNGRTLEIPQPLPGGDRAEDKYIYNGAMTCAAMTTLYGGKRVCSVGCLGMGDCIRSCKFDAIHMGP